MTDGKVRYRIVNLAVIALTAALFIHDYHDVRGLFAERDLWQILLIAATALIVHFIKGSRLFLAIYGSDMDMPACARIYCRVTPVSVILPFKLGEFFRMYCYGVAFNSLIRGAVTIILDRFMDTMALITVILLVLVFTGGHVSAFTYALLLFLLFVLLIYFVYPGVYRFWKRYFLRGRASERRLRFLAILDRSHELYKEITNISKGRGIILYFMSLIAWIIEISSLALLAGIQGDGVFNDTVTGYLSSAMGGEPSRELRQFIFLSVVLLVASFAAIQLRGLISRKKGISGEGHRDL